MNPPPDAPAATAFPPAFKLVRPVMGLLLAGWAVFLGMNAAWSGAPAVWRASEPGKLEVITRGGWWWGSLGAAVPAALLLMSTRWWLRPWPAFRPVGEEPAGPNSVPRRGPARPGWLLPAVLVLMVAGAALRIPRLGLSLYNDEAHVFRAQLAGEIPKSKMGQPDQFRPASWLSTLYENRAGNNSMPFSIAARTSYDTWRAFTKSPPGLVNEAALRLPVLVCGVLSIGAMGWLGFRLGGAWAALTTAALTALHPWHMRFSVEARSYGMLMLVLPLLFLALDTALRTGRWRHWLAFGFMQYLATATWFGSAHLLLGLNLILALLALAPLLPGFHRVPVPGEPESARSSGVPPRAVRWHLLVPAAVSGMLALGLYLQINLPHYLQLSKALANPAFFKTPHPFPLEWFQDVAGFFAAGIPGLAAPGAHPDQPSVGGFWNSGPAAWPALAGTGFFVAVAAAGFFRALRSGGAALVLAGATVGGAIFTWAWCSAKGIVFLKWYPLFLLPSVLLMAGLGLASLAGIRRWPARRRALLVPAAAGLIAAAWVPGLKCYAAHGRQNLRGAITLAMGQPFPEFLTVPRRPLYALLWSESAVYDRHSIPLKNAASLETLIARARSEDRPLFVACGHPASARVHSADMVALLEDAARFRLAGELPGLDEADTVQRVYQLLPDSGTPLAVPPAP